MSRISILIIFLLLFSSVQSFSQQNEDNIIRCFTVESEAQRALSNPQLGTEAQFEDWMAREVKRLKDNPPPRASRVIPTVVHVIYETSSQNISDAQVESQIQVLNDDFQRMNADTTSTPAIFDSVAANCEVEFCLARFDPDGNPSNGINRVFWSGSPFNTSFINSTIKPATSWDPNQYFNIWVMPLQSGLLGYAQFPDAPGLSGIGGNNGDANTDGIVVTYVSVGKPPANPFNGSYNRGRTATHEAGHWLGLRHIWGDGGCGQDDYCNDTPESDASNGNCPVTHVSCGTTDMVQNYMDYTRDNCMNIYTRDQKARIDVVLGASVRRASLLTSTVCVPAPVIGFSSNTSNITESDNDGTVDCRGYLDLDLVLNIGEGPVGDAFVQMIINPGTATLGVDYDTLKATALFPDGSLASQTFKLRIYDDGAVEGDEDINISFTIGSGTNATAAPIPSQTITIIDNDSDPEIGSQLPLLTEDFEGSATGWTVQAVLGNNNWNIGGGQGNMNGLKSAYISRTGANHFYARNQFAESRLVSPPVNASTYANLFVNFDWHCNGHQVNGVNLDYGRLSYSLDGINFVNIIGDSISTPFVKQSNNQNSTFALPSAVDGQTFWLGWEWVNDDAGGSQPPFAIDDVVISASIPVNIETTLSSLDEQYLGPNSTIYWFDNTTSELLLSIENTSSHDYGCTSVEIDREGSGATQYDLSDVKWALTDKTYLVTPANDNALGTYKVRLFFDKNEIFGWESASGQTRSIMSVAGSGGAISNVSPANPNANGNTNSFGGNVQRGVYGGQDFWVEGEFSYGFYNTSGFAAGVPEGVVGRNDLDEGINVTVWPNPFDHSFRVDLESEIGGNVRISLLDMMGKEVFRESIRLKSGQNRYDWNGNKGLNSGVYLLKIKGIGMEQVIKVIKM